MVFGIDEQSIPSTTKQKADDPTELTYMAMTRAEEDPCVINNTRTCTRIQINNSPRYPALSIGIELAKVMLWVQMGTLENGQPGYVYV